MPTNYKYNFNRICDVRGKFLFLIEFHFLIKRIRFSVLAYEVRSGLNIYFKRLLIPFDAKDVESPVVYTVGCILCTVNGSKLRNYWPVRCVVLMAVAAYFLKTAVSVNSPASLPRIPYS